MIPIQLDCVKILFKTTTQKLLIQMYNERDSLNP